jgi:hypothetical protein
MKAIKIGLLSLLLAPAFASNAYAYDYGYGVCHLWQPWTPVGPGGSFSFRGDFGMKWFTGIDKPSFPLTVFWHGTKNDIPDTPPGGAYAATIYSLGSHILGTYTNPWDGSWAGVYQRWFVVKDSLGRNFCTSNSALMILR